MMTSSQTASVTGTKDKDYNLLWYTEACLDNALRLEQYIEDAERDGDDEAADLFRKAQADGRKGAEQGKAWLRSRLPGCAAVVAVGLAGSSLSGAVSPAAAAVHTQVSSALQGSGALGAAATCDPHTPSSRPSDIVSVGGTVFFTADDGVRGRELWKSDGTA